MDKIIVISDHAKYGFDTSWTGTDKDNKRVTIKKIRPVETLILCKKVEPKASDLQIDTKFNFGCSANGVQEKHDQYS